MAALTEREVDDPVHPYIRIRDDGTIVVFSSQIEMGQGIHTGLATIVAEELDADFESIRVVNAANGRRGDRDVYGNPDLGGLFQITGSLELDERLLGQLPPDRGQGQSPPGRRGGRGVVSPAPRRSRSTPASSAIVPAHRRRSPSWRRAAEQLPVPDGVEPKAKAAYKLIGTEGRRRVDAPDKILATTRYTIDTSAFPVC